MARRSIAQDRVELPSSLRIQRAGKRLSERSLARFERGLGHTLPDGYRMFLLAFNGGTPSSQSVRTFRGKEPTETITYFLGIKTGHRYDLLEETVRNLKGDEEPRIPTRMLPIANDAFGNVYCISLCGKDVGRVYLWSHEDEFSQKRKRDGSVGDSAMIPIAPSFTAFLSQICDDDPEPDAEPPNNPPARTSHDRLTKSQRDAAWRTAIKSGRVENVRKILRQGGNPNLGLNKGDTPLSLAIDAWNRPMVRALLEGGADKQDAYNAAIANDAFEIAHDVLDAGYAPKLTDWELQLLLGDCDDARLIERLIELGAPVHARMQRGNALFHACETVADPDVVRLLIKHGVPVDEPCHATVARTPLACAIILGRLKTCEILIDAGAQLYAVPPSRGKSMSEEMIEAELKKPKPDQDFIQWQQSIVDHNRPKPPAYFLDVDDRTRRIARKVIAYAKARGQMPPAT